MFENLVVGQKVTVHLGIATSVTGIVIDASAEVVTFIGDITLFASDGWELEGK